MKLTTAGGDIMELNAGVIVPMANTGAIDTSKVSRSRVRELLAFSVPEVRRRVSVPRVFPSSGIMKQDMLNRMDYLATQSANGTYDNEVDRAALQKEVEQLKSR